MQWLDFLSTFLNSLLGAENQACVRDRRSNCDRFRSPDNQERITFLQKYLKSSYPESNNLFILVVSDREEVCCLVPDLAFFFSKIYNELKTERALAKPDGGCANALDT